jgi:hypothetical protein
LIASSYIGHVLRAGDDEVVDAAELDRLVDPQLAGARGVLAFQFLHPDATAARAAAERVVAVSRHLDELGAERLEHLARRVVDAVVAAERARVVVGDAVAEALLHLQAPTLDQLEQELRRSITSHSPPTAGTRS